MRPVLQFIRNDGFHNLDPHAGRVAVGPYWRDLRALLPRRARLRKVAHGGRQIGRLEPVIAFFRLIVAHAACAADEGKRGVVPCPVVRCPVVPCPVVPGGIRPGVAVHLRRPGFRPAVTRVVDVECHLIRIERLMRRIGCFGRVPLVGLQLRIMRLRAIIRTVTDLRSGQKISSPIAVMDVIVAIRAGICRHVIREIVAIRHLRGNR